ncbi:hypothetical protein KIPB_007624 [Kipferlia bialata]|uniref:Uncharacterized protein n=1 Tax=Kipferlia bialata TaxID=797122 RepID=A0A9K3D0A8_9EUKA|nr:hypothetical protein KIPB_007624 [Kipferlia bialata]|eukprot:g7624.t1
MISLLVCLVLVCLSLASDVADTILHPIQFPIGVPTDFSLILFDSDGAIVRNLPSVILLDSTSGQVFPTVFDGIGTYTGLITLFSETTDMYIVAGDDTVGTVSVVSVDLFSTLTLVEPLTAGSSSFGHATAAYNGVVMVGASQDQGLGPRSIAACGPLFATATSISLAGNNFGDEGCYELAIALMDNTALTSLDLRSCGIGAVGAAAIFDALQSCTGLTSLLLGVLPGSGSRNHLMRAGVDALVAYLPKAQGLEELDLESASAGSEPQLLADGISACPTLRRLGLGGNNLGSDGALSLALALPSTGVTRLDVSRNKIPDVAAAELVRSLGYSVLEGLIIGANPLGQETADAVADMLTLPCRRERERQTQEEEREREAIERRRAWLETLAEGSGEYYRSYDPRYDADSPESPEDEEGSEGEGEREGVKRGPKRERLCSLISLSLAGCRLGNKGVLSLAAGLDDSKVLRELDLAGNDLTHEGVHALAEALPKVYAFMYMFHYLQPV